MVKFDFTVTDADAENIMEIMRNQIMHNNQHILELMADPNYPTQEHYIEAYKQDNEYIVGLIKKMNNTRVEE